MRYYLDTCIVIYGVEGQPPFRQRAQYHIAALESTGHHFVISDLTWTECLVKPLGARDGPLLVDYLRFFLGPNVATVSLTAAAHQRAAMIRGTHKYASNKSYGLADSLHLAIAIESRGDRFLTNDHRLAGFPDITIDVLP
jgi:predicted nucleic acid-binding protein